MVRGLALASLVLVATSATTAGAEPARVGDTFTVFTRPGVTRFADVAHDPQAGAWLVVSGQSGVTGALVTSAGVEDASFSISDHPEAYSPRVAAAGGGFVACFLVEATMSVVCRRVERATPPVIGPEQVVTSGSVGHLESAPSLGCTPSECLVTWVDGPELAVRARRIGHDAAPIGAVMDLAATDGVFEAFPAVAASESLAQYLIAYTHEPSGGPMSIWGRRVSVANDVPAAPANELYTGSGLNNYPEIAFDPERERHLAISWLSEGNPDVAGQLLSADGSPIGARLAIAATSGFEGGDGIGLCFDAAADAYLAVYQGPETPGQAQQVWASAIDVDGQSFAQFQVTESDVQNGIYQPRVASDGNGRLLVVTVADHQRVDGQFVELEISADGGAGAGGSGGGSWDAGAGASSGAAGGASGSAGGGSTSNDDGGCGCRAAPRAPSGASVTVALLALALRLRRRRRS